MSGIRPISGRARPNQLATLKQCYSELRRRGAGDGGQLRPTVRQPLIGCVVGEGVGLVLSTDLQHTLSLVQRHRKLFELPSKCTYIYVTEVEGG